VVDQRRSELHLECQLLLGLEKPALNP